MFDLNKCLQLGMTHNDRGLQKAVELNARPIVCRLLASPRLGVGLSIVYNEVLKSFRDKTDFD